MRNGLLLGLALVLLAGLSGCGSVADPTTWMDSETAIEPNDLPELAEPKRVVELWQRDIGGSDAELNLGLSPVVAEGRLYVANAEGLVQALDAASGKTLWQQDLEMPLSGGPGVGEGLVLVGSSDGDLIALETDSGAERWRANVGGEVLSTPAAALGTVVVHTLDGKLVGLNALDGKRRWIYQQATPTLTLRGSSSPVISGASVICGFAGGKIVSLSLDSGVVQWEVGVTAPAGRSELERIVDIDGDPLLINGVIFVATFQGELVAISEASGTILWRYKLSSAGSVAGDWRYLYVSDEIGQVWAIDGDNGSAAWKQDGLLYRGVSSPAVLDGYVIVGDYEGYVHWISHADGQFRGRLRVGSDPIRATPLVVNDTVYVFGEGGALAALRPPKAE